MTQRDTAALLAAQAFQLADTVTTRAALLSNFTAGGGFLDTHRMDGVGSSTGGRGIVMPDGQTAFYTDADGRLRPYDLETGAVGEPFASVGSDPYPILEVSPDSTLVAQGSWQGSGDEASTVVGLLDTATGGLRFPPVVVDNGVTDMTFSADSRRLVVSVFPDASLIALDTATGDVVATAAGLEIDEPYAQSFSMATSADEVLVGTSKPGTLRVFDSTTLDLRRSYELPADLADHMVDVGDGTVVTAGRAGVARFAVATGEPRWVRDARDACGPLAVVPSRGLVFCGNVFGRLEERDLDTGLILRSISAQNGNTGQMWPANDGRELVAFGENEPVVSRWRLDGTGPTSRPPTSCS